MKLKLFLISSIFLIIIPPAYLVLDIIPELQLCSLSDLFLTYGNIVVLIITVIPIIFGVLNLYFFSVKRINKFNYVFLSLGIFFTLTLILIGKLGVGPLYLVICDINTTPFPLR